MFIAAAMKTEKATFAAGCFWGVEATFRQINGVKSTQVGYMGGSMRNPTYEDVCTDRTGHAEAIEIEFDSKKITYKALLEKFFSLHDPTQINRQGPDVGSQYRSAIFYHSEAQKREAMKARAGLEKSGKLDKPVSTGIVKAKKFHPAEDYHQKYLEKRGALACH